MINDANEKPYAEKKSALAGASRVIGLGLISAASAIAGGVAMAWWYRKTISKLQNPIAEGATDPKESHKLELKQD